MSKVRIWLDDQRNPQDKETQNRFGATSDMIWIKHPDLLKDMLLSNQIGFISFDHDLGFISSNWLEDMN